MNKKAQLISWLTTNCACWKGQEAALNKHDEAQLEKLKADAEKATENAAIVAKLGGRSVEELLANQKSTETPKPPEKPATGSLEEWEAQMPPAARAIWNAAKQAAGARKNEIIQELVANATVEEKDKPALILAYNQMDEKQLELVLAGMPKKQKARPGQPTPPPLPPNYGGAGGNRQTQVDNTKQVDKKAILRPPAPLVNKALKDRLANAGTRVAGASDN